MGSKYDREFNLGKGSISIETIIDDKGLQAFVRTLERIGSGSGLDKYVVGVNGSLKDLDAALEEVSSAAKRFEASVSTANAQELVKQVRAFEAIGGAPIKNIVSNYEELSPVLERAAEMAGNLGNKFSSQAFNDAAVGFAAFTKAGGDAGDFIKRFGEDTELLQKQIRGLTSELGYYKAEVERLEKEAGENGVEQLKSLKETMTEELGAFMTANNIDKNDYMFSDLFEDIENGSKTAGQAIAEFKSNYGYLLEELRGSGDAIDSSKIDNMVTSLSVLYDMLEEVRNGVRAIIADGIKIGEVVPAEASDGMERAADSAKELSKGIESVEKVAPILEGVADAEIKAGYGAEKSYGSITELVNTLKQFGEIGPDSLKSVQLSLYNLSNIKGINVGEKSKENIISLLTDISTLSFSPGGLSVISTMNFNAFKELRVSKASLDNLATYLPQIAKVPVDNLLQLSKVDLHNFNDLHISKSNLEPIKDMTTASDKMVEATEVMKTSLENIREVAGQTLGAFVPPEDTAAIEQLTTDVDVLAQETETIPAAAEHASEGIEHIGETAKMTSDAVLKMEGELEAANDITTQLKKDTEKVTPKGDSPSDVADRKDLAAGMAKLYTTRKKLNEEMARRIDITATMKQYYEEQEAQRSLIKGMQDLEAERKREADEAKKAAAEKAAADKKEAEALAKRIADAKKADAGNAKKKAEQNDSYISNNPVAQNQYLSSISNLLKTTGAEYLRYTQIAEDGTRNVIQGYESQEESVKALAVAMKDLEELRGMVESGEDMSTSDVSQLYTDAKAKIDMATEALFKYEQATGSVSSAETRRLEQLDKIQKAMNAVQAEMNAYTDEKTGYGAAGKETATYAEMERAYEALKDYHAEITATGADTGKDVVTNNQFAASFNKINAQAKLAVDTAKAKIAADKEEIKTTNEASVAEKKRAEEREKANQTMRDGETLLNKIAAAQRNWTAAANGTTSSSYNELQKYADAVHRANKDLKDGTIDAREYKKTIAGLKNDFDKTSRTIAGAGENMKSFGDRIGDITSKFGMWLSTSRIIMTVVRYLKQMITTTIELDDAMTQLRIVTGESDSTYEKFGNTVAESAKKLGVSMKDLIDATTTYSRLGLTNSPFVW